MRTVSFSFLLTCILASVPASAHAAIVGAENVSTEDQSAQITVVVQSIGGDATFGFTGKALEFSVTTVGGVGSTTLVEPIAPERYGLSELPTSGWVLASSSCTTGTDTMDFPLHPGDRIVCTFTNVKRHDPKNAEVSGTVFNDVNENGVRERGERGLSGHVIYIDTNKNGARDTGEIFATTNRQGVYRLRGLAAGSYLIREDQPAGWRDTFPVVFPEGYVVHHEFSLSLSTSEKRTGIDFSEVYDGPTKSSRLRDIIVQRIAHIRDIVPDVGNQASSSTQEYHDGSLPTPTVSDISTRLTELIDTIRADIPTR